MRVFFVCAGNICRSPMAEALAARYARERPALTSVVIGSAGVAAWPGDGPTGETIEAMRELFAIDITRHRAQRFPGAEAADLVLTVDASTRDRAAHAAPDARVELLGDFAGFPGEEVDDPYGRSADAFRGAAEQIDRLVRGALDRLVREHGAHDA